MNKCSNINFAGFNIHIIERQTNKIKNKSGPFNTFYKANKTLKQLTTGRGSKQTNKTLDHIILDEKYDEHAQKIVNAKGPAEKGKIMDKIDSGTFNVKA